MIILSLRKFLLPESSLHFPRVQEFVHLIILVNFNLLKFSYAMTAPQIHTRTCVSNAFKKEIMRVIDLVFSQTTQDGANFIVVVETINLSKKEQSVSSIKKSS